MSAWLVRIAMVAGISALVGGCGGTGSPPPKPPTSSKPAPAAVDLSTLDTGKYSTIPRKLGQVLSEDEGRIAEATRMGEAVIDPTKVDPSLVKKSFSESSASASEAAHDISRNGRAIVEPVLTKYGMIALHLEQAASEEEGMDRKLISVILLRFPDETSAGSAAVEMDAADFAVNRENVAVPITKYPTAHGHWRPSDPTMASTMAHGPFVVQVNVENPTPNLQTLTGMVEKTFDEEIALLDKFQPTPVNGIAKLPKDPDGLIGRLVNLTPGIEPTLSKSVGTYGPNGALTNQTERQHKARVYETAGVDRLALWYDDKLGYSEILRARDPDAATKLLNDLIATNADPDVPIDGPRGLPDAKCFENKNPDESGQPELRFYCKVPYDRYVAVVSSADQADVRQRAAAQYALLVNPL
jgi:hypothetical protein